MRRYTLATIVAVALAAMLLLLGGYMGAYYAMLRGRDSGTVHGWTMPADPIYRCGDSQLAGQFFWPAHQLDRRMRPAFWKPSKGFEGLDFD